MVFYAPLSSQYYLKFHDEISAMLMWNELLLSRVEALKELFHVRQMARVHGMTCTLGCRSIQQNSLKAIHSYIAANI
jgi:hypothetical protein